MYGKRKKGKKKASTKPKKSKKYVNKNKNR